MSQLTHMMEQVNKLKNGVGVQSLLDAAYNILGNPIVLFDTEYKLLAHTECITDDPYWNEIITHGMFSEETLRFFGNEGFIEDVANNPRIIYMGSEKIKYDRIGGKIFNKNNTFVSLLLIVACNKPFEENDSIVFEAICKIISKEISKIDFYQEYEQTHQDTIIEKLINGNYDIRLDIAQMEIIYDSLESSLYIAVADLSQCDPECTNMAYFRDRFKQAEPAYKYAIYLNYIIIIISTNDDNLNVTKAFSKLIALFEQDNIYAGISSRFENLFELRKHYEEALNAMQYALERKSAQRVFPCHASSINTMRKIDALENGLGIQYFLNIGPEIFGNPLLFHDMELNLLACTEDVEISDPIWQELITYGTSSDETIELFRTEGFIGIMENTKGGAILRSDKIKYDRISWRVYSKENIMIGCLSIVNSMNPFTDDTLVLFGAFSQKFSNEVGKIAFYNQYGQVYSNTIINRLLSGNIDVFTFYSEDIGNLYDSLMENLYLFVIDIAQCKSEQVNLTYFRDLFNRSDAVNRYAIYFNYIVIIISIERKLLSESKLREISKEFEQNGIYAGVSNRFDNIYELQKHYNEAVYALNSGMKHRERHRKQRIFQYDNSENDS